MIFIDRLFCCLQIAHRKHLKTCRGIFNARDVAQMLLMGSSQEHLFVNVWKDSTDLQALVLVTQLIVRVCIVLSEREGLILLKSVVPSYENFRISKIRTKHLGKKFLTVS